MNKQLSFLKSKDLGFDKENVIYIHTYGKLHDKKELEYLKTSLLKNPDILSIAFRGNIPTEWQSGRPLSKNPDNKNIVAMERISVDKDYFNLMKIHFIEGENIFSHSSDYNELLYSEQSSCRSFGHQTSLH